jgi:hypothetical protein
VQFAVAAAALGSSHLEGADAGPPRSAEVRSAARVGGGGVQARRSGHSGGVQLQDARQWVWWRGGGGGRAGRGFDAGSWGAGYVGDVVGRADRVWGGWSAGGGCRPHQQLRVCGRRVGRAWEGGCFFGWLGRQWRNSSRDRGAVIQAAATNYLCLFSDQCFFGAMQGFKAEIFLKDDLVLLQ